MAIVRQLEGGNVRFLLARGKREADEGCEDGVKCVFHFHGVRIICAIMGCANVNYLFSLG